jgi:hypothetical protein
MTPRKWLARFWARFLAETDIPAGLVRAAFPDTLYRQLRSGYELDPEGAADREIAYWAAMRGGLAHEEPVRTQAGHAGPAKRDARRRDVQGSEHEQHEG